MQPRSFDVCLGRLLMMHSARLVVRRLALTALLFAAAGPLGVTLGIVASLNIAAGITMAVGLVALLLLPRMVGAWRP